MLKKLKKIISFFKTEPNEQYKFKNIVGSVITIIRRSDFEINEKWFNNLLSVNYADIEHLYESDLHQDNSYSRNQLNDIIKFEIFKSGFLNEISECLDCIKRYENSYHDFHQHLKAEKIAILNPNDACFIEIKNLFNSIKELKLNLKFLEEVFKNEGYWILTNYSNVKKIPLPITNTINLKPSDWNLLLDKKPDYNILRYVIQYFNQVLNRFNELDRKLDNYLSNKNHKIIIGNAGMGKSHLTAHLVSEISKQKDNVIFFKPKCFNGDDVDFEKRLLTLLNVPKGYTLEEILSDINKYSTSKGKRTFIIIDALNETTKAHIGFSNIWKNSLQRFINQIKNHSNLYLICSLRTSYVERIWDSKPNGIIELKGFGSFKDTKEACGKYFDHYLIKATNINTADLKIFNAPLLLDLFCKLTNENRRNLVEIELNITSYIKIFDDYIHKLIFEVKNKLDFDQTLAIETGINRSSEKFLKNNQGELSTNDYSSSFDINPLVSTDNSIARAVLEGYLIYIKDFIGKPNEIVKHTQQEIGGFLLAKKLVSDYPLTQDLIKSNVFSEKIIGTDDDKIHQLRFDILKFLIALKPDLILKSENEYVQKLSWWHIYNSDLNKVDPSIIEHISNPSFVFSSFTYMLDSSSQFWFIKEHPFNFNFIYQNLKSISQWNYDLSWSSFIYNEAGILRNIIRDFIEELKSKHNLENLILKSKFITTILSTNIRELRDLSTSALLAFGIKHPITLLKLSIDTKDFKDTYIYERMVVCCYGVVLYLQNDKNFVNDVLPYYAKHLYDMQFKHDTIFSVYNYIVTDSIKHIIDLAILKGVFKLKDEDLEMVKNYQFTAPTKWIAPTKKEQNLINSSHESSPPEPLRMDFGIYTIPRLIDRKDTNTNIAIANIYSRIFQLGFKELDLDQDNNLVNKEFHWGHTIYRMKSKVDRLGKKYCWLAFFDFAGKLLLDKNLNVWSNGDSECDPYYERLGDVDIDISKPPKDYILKKQLFFEDLLKEKRIGHEKWNNIDKTVLIKGLITQKFDNEGFTLLYGFIDQREDESYDTRSFLKIETIFIDAKRLTKIKNIEKGLYEWNDEVYTSPSNLNHAYFGELYWADTIPSPKRKMSTFPTGRLTNEIRYLNSRDLLKDEYKDFSIGDEIKCEIPEKIGILSEPTLMDYLWESDSEVYKTFSEFVPSANLGKALNLRADCNTGNILDKNLKIASKSVEFENDNFYKENFNFLRTGLLQEYLKEKNLALVYQIKQHTYDKSYRHYRKLKFFIHE